MKAILPKLLCLSLALYLPVEAQFAGADDFSFPPGSSKIDPFKWDVSVLNNLDNCSFIGPSSGFLKMQIVHCRFSVSSNLPWRQELPSDKAWSVKVDVERESSSRNIAGSSREHLLGIYLEPDGRDPSRRIGWSWPLLRIGITKEQIAPDSIVDGYYGALDSERDDSFDLLFPETADFFSVEMVFDPISKQIKASYFRGGTLMFSRNWDISDWPSNLESYRVGLFTKQPSSQSGLRLRDKFAFDNFEVRDLSNEGSTGELLIDIARAFTISFKSEVGVVYSLEASSDGASWISVGDSLIGDGNDKRFVVESDRPMQFYRVTR